MAAPLHLSSDSDTISPGGFWREAAARLRRRLTPRLLGLGLVAFGLLTLRFSPNWLSYIAGYREAVAFASSEPERAAVEKAYLRGYSERGYYVVQQTRDLRTEIDNPLHKITRWRLLVPLLVHVLQLPGWVALGTAHLGALVLVLIFASLGYRPGLPHPGLDALAIAVIAGAGAPFFTSMGWLGYYDAWVAVALILAALAPARWNVIAVCVLAPWIDERFVLGLPLALLVRWCRSGDALGVRAWLRREALWPLAIAAGYALVRLQLGGSGGSQSTSDYYRAFMQGYDIPLVQRLRAAWEGIRFSWIFVAAALAGCAVAGGTFRAGRATAVGSVMLATLVAGLATALDLSRSMVLLVPLVAWGAIEIQRFSWWRRPLVLVGCLSAALVWPAFQVVNLSLVPVEHVASTRDLAMAQNHLGITYAMGYGVPKNPEAAAHWYRRAADHGYASAQLNLGVLYLMGEGVPKDVIAARELFLAAAAQGSINAQNNLGFIYTRGEGVPSNLTRAYSWFYLAAQRGQQNAATNLRSLRPYLPDGEVAAAEAMAREFVRDHPHALQTTDDVHGTPTR